MRLCFPWPKIATKTNHLISMKNTRLEIVASAHVEGSSSCEEEDVCWLCLAPGSAHQPLINQCACPSLLSHKMCVARWQLQQAGREEETNCRFCKHTLAPWPEAYAHLAKSPNAVMTIAVAGIKHIINVRKGPEGAEAFRNEIRRLYGLSPDDAVDISFSCCVPGSSETLTLYSWQAFDAAVECAAFANAKQQQGEHLQQKDQQRDSVERLGDYSEGSSSSEDGMFSRIRNLFRGD